MEAKNTRRNFLQKTALLTASTFVTSTIFNSVFAKNKSTSTVFTNQEAVNGIYTLPNLNFTYDALEPHFDKLTMEIHHTKHHNAYVTNLNKAIESADENLKKSAQSLSGIFENINKFSETIRNNAGGHYNHSLFWTLLKPNGGGQPTGNLAADLVATFGSFELFKKAFSEAASKRFGSGWAWLIISDGKLVITSTANQDNPLMHLKSKKHTKGTPILALDVWEHAYYLKNQNRRADYIASFWNVVDWQKADELYALNNSK